MTPDRRWAVPALWAALRLLGLALLTGLVVSEIRPGFSGSRLTALALLAVAALAWVAWVGASAWGRAGVTVGAVAVLGAGGGSLAVFAPGAIAFVGVAGLGAGTAIELPGALGLAAVAPAALAVAAGLDGRPSTLVLEGIVVALAGLVIGISRRHNAGRIQQAAMLAVERERAGVERARADVLAERNRLAREIHDVLAHTLGALSVRLEALDTLMDDPRDSETLREGLRSTRRLVGEGLQEARQAVRALRDNPLPVAQQLARLTDAPDVALTVSGPIRPLPPEVNQTLYRAAQEAITNARKHSPGAPVAVTLLFDAAAVSLSVTNPVTDRAPLASPIESGYGLQGMRERALLLHGQVDAGPTDAGWRVLLRLPA
ncbi:MAG: sensor histidine kinase [Candidatus Dormibacteria bacterium]